MSEKLNQNEGKTEYKKERFEFSLTINGHYVCQRFFKINGFNYRSVYSIELVEAIDRCVSLIDNDLKMKTIEYLEYTSPVFFTDKSAMDNWVEKTVSAKNEGVYSGTYSITPFSFVAVPNSECEDGYDKFVWTGEEMEPYYGPLNISDYVKRDNEKCVLKFSFLDGGREVCSKTWDASVYPKFVRSNIDLSNSKNKYEKPKNGVYLAFESSLIKLFNESRSDLIPVIVKDICHTCSKRKGYTIM